LELKASSTGGNAIDITYNFVDPVSNKNAGHVYGIANNLNSSRSQNFTFDQVNRITSAGTTSTSGQYCWGYQYSYDVWGNLLAQAGWTPTYNGCSETVMAGVTADASNHISGLSYDPSGNTLTDGANTYNWDGESQLKSAGGVNYLYDGDGRRVSKSNGKLYWYGSGGEILAETDALGNTLNEYIFFGGKRVALLPAGSAAQFYAEDLLGSSRIVTTNTGIVCYDADFTPYGGEIPYINTCAQNKYKFEGKERDAETGNDDFGARYYSNRFGRWLSADWSSVPVAVPYANLTNPQTLNLYSMVADDPESFADLDGHAQASDLKDSLLGEGQCCKGSLSPEWVVIWRADGYEHFTPQTVGAASSASSATLGIGIEVPVGSAVKDGVLNVATDPGHVFVFLKDSTGKVVAMLSFGPDAPPADNKTPFKNGDLPGNVHWKLEGEVSVWQSNISSKQLTAGMQLIADFKVDKPHYTIELQCTTASLSIAKKVGLTLPNGVGPIIARRGPIQIYSGNVANPYQLSQQMRAQFGTPETVRASSFPVP
jgi:RHS repeat-associated protein